MSTIYTYDQFIVFVGQELERLRKEGGDWRMGQVYFNCLWEFRPEIANKIRATKLDPFHREQIHPDVHTFVENEWLQMNERFESEFNADTQKVVD